jgi:hypothetical protein
MVEICSGGSGGCLDGWCSQWYRVDASDAAGICSLAPACSAAKTAPTSQRLPLIAQPARTCIVRGASMAYQKPYHKPSAPPYDLLGIPCASTR